MTNYKEIIAQCMYCPGLERCSVKLEDTVLMPNMQVPEDINCEYFPKLCIAIKEYVQNEILKEFTKYINKEN